MADLKNSAKGIDVIGDVHGKKGQLVTLLRALGYRQTEGIWRHESRQALFVGDLINKGSDPGGVLKLVQRMVQAGQARMVLGNHELNWIHEAADDAGEPEAFLKATARRMSRRQLAEDFATDPEELVILFQWLREQPLVIDEPQFRVVHACWNDESVRVLKTHSNNCLDDTALAGYRATGSDLYFAMDLAVAGCAHTWRSTPDPAGYLTNRERVGWWRPGAAHIHRESVPPALEEHRHYSADAPPVFFGHYAMTGTPILQDSNQVCVDYAAAYGGRLVAYRHTPGEPLAESHFVGV